jgi:hypothetical protein
MTWCFAQLLLWRLDCWERGVSDDWVDQVEWGVRLEYAKAGLL